MKIISREAMRSNDGGKIRDFTYRSSVGIFCEKYVWKSVGKYINDQHWKVTEQLLIALGLNYRSF